jgi:hypothetical protein
MNSFSTYILTTFRKPGIAIYHQKHLLKLNRVEGEYRTVKIFPGVFRRKRSIKLPFKELWSITTSW